MYFDRDFVGKLDCDTYQTAKSQNGMYFGRDFVGKFDCNAYQIKYV